MPSPPLSFQYAHFWGNPDHPAFRVPEAWVGNNATLTSGCEYPDPFQLLVVPSNSLGLKEVHQLELLLEDRGNASLLILLEDRGLSGFENLLARQDVHLVPFPWNPELLGMAFSKLSTPPPPSKQPDLRDYLDGAVEGLRDPLTSLSGYLQLMEGDGDGKDLAGPALRSAKEMELILESVSLSSGKIESRFDYQALRPLGKMIVQIGRSLGRELLLDWKEDCAAETDRRFFLSCLFVSLLLSDRFGPGTPLTLQAQLEGDVLNLLWVESKEKPASTPSNSVAPPSFLPQTLETLAVALGGQAIINKRSGQQIIAAGIQITVCKKRPARGSKEFKGVQNLDTN